MTRSICESSATRRRLSRGSASWTLQKKCVALHRRVLLSSGCCWLLLAAARIVLFQAHSRHAPMRPFRCCHPSQSEAELAALSSKHAAETAASHETFREQLAEMSRAAAGSEATAQLLEAAERREKAAAEKAAAHAEEAAAHSQALALLRDEHRGATEGLTMCVRRSTSPPSPLSPFPSHLIVHCMRSSSLSLSLSLSLPRMQVGGRDVGDRRGVTRSERGARRGDRRRARRGRCGSARGGARQGGAVGPRDGAARGAAHRRGDFAPRPTSD